MSERTQLPEGWVYVLGVCRNTPNATKAHVYAGPHYGALEGPLCGYGWNRGNGESFSIWRNNPSYKGTCQTCQMRMDANRGPVEPWPHKTRWL